MDPLEYASKFSERLSQLRTKSNVSARDMSLTLGQSECYINKIENKKSFPSMMSFFYICEYLKIEPNDFFNFTIDSPQLSTDLEEELSLLSESEREHILLLLRDMNALRKKE